MSELRSALDAAGSARGRHHLLTFAAGAFPEFLAHIEMRQVQAVVDFVNLMTYDFREAEGDPRAGHHAPLYRNPDDPNPLSSDSVVRDFLAAGVPPHKLVLGVPFYGRVWGGVQGTGDGLWQPGGPPSERLDTSYGALAALVGKDGFVRHFDAWAQAPYLWNPEKRLFVTYDDPQSLGVKSRYIREHGLGGAMFWEYTADPTGALLGALFDGLRR
jgi:chitinase